MAVLCGLGLRASILDGVDQVPGTGRFHASAADALQSIQRVG